MGFLNKKKDTNVECHLCRGDGIDRKEYMALLRLCQRCNGHGYVDWVAGAVKGSSHKPKVNKDMQLRIAHQNIDILRHKIIDIGMEVGVHITVDIKALKTEDMMTMTQRAFPHAIKTIKLGDY